MALLLQTEAGSSGAQRTDALLSPTTPGEQKFQRDDYYRRTRDPERLQIKSTGIKRELCEEGVREELRLGDTREGELDRPLKKRRVTTITG